MPEAQRTVIVTGASSGIGFGVAQAYLARGYNVIGNGRSQDRLDAAARLLDTAAERFGQVDIRPGTGQAQHQGERGRARGR